MSVNMNLMTAPVYATVDDQDPNFKHTGPEDRNEFHVAQNDGTNNIYRHFYDHTLGAEEMIGLTNDLDAIAGNIPDDDTKVFSNLLRTSEALRDTTLYETNREQYVHNVLSPLEEAMQRSDGQLFRFLSFLRKHIESQLPNQPRHTGPMEDEDFQQLINDSTTELNNALKDNELTEEERKLIGGRLYWLGMKIPDDTSRVYRALVAASEKMNFSMNRPESGPDSYWRDVAPHVKRARQYTDGPLRDYLDKLWDAIPYEATHSDKHPRLTGPLDDKDYPDALERSKTNIDVRLRDKKFTSEEYIGFADDLRVLASYIPDDDSRVNRAMLRAADALVDMELLANNKTSYLINIQKHLIPVRRFGDGPLGDYSKKLWDALLEEEMHSPNQQRHTGPLGDKDYLQDIERFKSDIDAHLGDKQFDKNEYVGVAEDLRRIAGFIPDDDSRVHREMLLAADILANTDLLAGDKSSYLSVIAKHLGHAKKGADGVLRDALDKLWDALPLDDRYQKRNTGPSENKDYLQNIELFKSNIDVHGKDKQFDKKEYTGVGEDLRKIAGFILDDDSRVHRTLLLAADAFTNTDLLASDKSSYLSVIAKHLGNARNGTDGLLRDALDKLWDAMVLSSSNQQRHTGPVGDPNFQMTLTRIKHDVDVGLQDKRLDEKEYSGLADSMRVLAAYIPDDASLVHLALLRASDAFANTGLLTSDPVSYVSEIAKHLGYAERGTDGKLREVLGKLWESLPLDAESL